MIRMSVRFRLSWEERKWEKLEDLSLNRRPRRKDNKGMSYVC